MRTLPAAALAALVTGAATEGATDRASWPKAIEDNSFFIEEAYNQEDRVVQHISNLSAFIRPQVDFAFAFTQEWPAGGQRHQLSYTVPWLSVGSNDAAGPGDLLLNYRFQWVLQENGAALAPRLSFVFPTADEDLGIDRTGLGAQVNIPFSCRLARDWALHANAGYSVIPGVRPVQGAATPGDQTFTFASAGASIVWLLRPALNLMFEAVATRADEFDDNGRVRREGEIIVSPGLRAAIDRRDLQIVPGVAVPVRFQDGGSDVGLFLYLSFEHPFGDR